MEQARISPKNYRQITKGLKSGVVGADWHYNRGSKIWAGVISDDVVTFTAALENGGYNLESSDGVLSKVLWWFGIPVGTVENVEPTGFTFKTKKSVPAVNPWFKELQEQQARFDAVTPQFDDPYYAVLEQQKYAELAAVLDDVVEAPENVVEEEVVDVPEIIEEKKDQEIEQPVLVPVAVSPLDDVVQEMIMSLNELEPEDFVTIDNNVVLTPEEIVVDAGVVLTVERAVVQVAVLVEEDKAGTEIEESEMVQDSDVMTVTEVEELLRSWKGAGRGYVISRGVRALGVDGIYIDYSLEGDVVVLSEDNVRKYWVSVVPDPLPEVEALDDVVPVLDDVVTIESRAYIIPAPPVQAPTVGVLVPDWTVRQLSLWCSEEQVQSLLALLDSTAWSMDRVIIERGETVGYQYDRVGGGEMVIYLSGAIIIHGNLASQYAKVPYKTFLQKEHNWTQMIEQIQG